MPPFPPHVEFQSVVSLFVCLFVCFFVSLSVSFRVVKLLLIVIVSNSNDIFFE